jgi:hypothetical protein
VAKMATDFMIEGIVRVGCCRRDESGLRKNAKEKGSNEFCPGSVSNLVNKSGDTCCEVVRL